MAGGAALTSAKQTGNPLRTGFVRRDCLWAFALVTSLFFLWGFAYGLLDVLNKHFQNVLGITKLQSTGLQVAYFGIGYFCYSPLAGEILKRKGYKVTIISGLCLYSLGAILFWPVAKASTTSTNRQAIFGGFVACTAVIACGLASLEVAANSYVSTLEPLNVASFRLQFSQSFNGVASFTGPLIASKFFFSGGNENNLTNVQWVYLAVALLGVSVIVAFVFTKLPETSEEALQAEADALAEVGDGAISDAHKPFYRTKAIFGFVAQFMYVGAQVTIGSFFINYCAEEGVSDARASQLLSYALILFTVGRFVGTALLSFLSPSLLLLVYSLICCVFVVLISVLKGMSGVACLMVIMFFESIMYPVIFVLGTTGLGHHTRRAAGLLVMGVAGGAVFPPIQGAIADAKDTRTSYWINLPAFAVIAAFAATRWIADGRKWGVGGGELEREVEASVGGMYPPAEVAGRLSLDEKKMGGGDMDYVERVDRVYK
jgi:FHS family L-fucose permease-like MFS transporter